MIKLLNSAFVCVILLTIAGCADGKWEAKYPTGYDRTETHGDIYAPRDTIWKNGSPIDKALHGKIRLNK